MALPSNYFGPGCQGQNAFTSSSPFLSDSILYNHVTDIHLHCTFLKLFVWYFVKAQNLSKYPIKMTMSSFSQWQHFLLCECCKNHCQVSQGYGTMQILHHGTS